MSSEMDLVIRDTSANALPELVSLFRIYENMPLMFESDESGLKTDEDSYSSCSTIMSIKEFLCIIYSSFKV